MARLALAALALSAALLIGIASGAGFGATSGRKEYECTPLYDPRDCVIIIHSTYGQDTGCELVCDVQIDGDACDGDPDFTENTGGWPGQDSAGQKADQQWCGYECDTNNVADGDNCWVFRMPVEKMSWTTKSNNTLVDVQCKGAPYFGEAGSYPDPEPGQLGEFCKDTQYDLYWSFWPNDLDFPGADEYPITPLCNDCCTVSKATYEKDGTFMVSCKSLVGDTDLGYNYGR